MSNFIPKRSLLKEYNMQQTRLATKLKRQKELADMQKEITELKEQLKDTENEKN